jgi:predicted DsbA family dithiol-disulfide isomerase
MEEIMKPGTMADTLVVDVWSDVVCPFCYLGSRQLEAAIEQFEHRDDVVLRHRAFELDPTTPLTFDKPLEELVSEKYHIPVERSRAMHRQLEEQARSFDMEWSFASARATNSFDAHRLIALAESQGFGESMSQRLFKAYFSDGLLISDHDVLNALASEVGVEGAPSLWTGDALSAEVRADEAAAAELGISGVPAMLIGNKFMVLGAQGTEKILETLRRAWQRQDA